MKHFQGRNYINGEWETSSEMYEKINPATGKCQGSFPMSNASTVTIEPPLRTALANDSSVTYDSVPFNVHLVSDTQEFNSGQVDKDGNLLFVYEFDVIESL